MKLIRVAGAVGALACAAMGGAMSARAAPPAPVAQPIVVIEDVARFYQLYDAAGGHPSAERLQRDYIDPGSEGLHHLAKVRNVTGATVAAALEKRPEIYSDAKRCMAVLPQVRQRLRAALSNLFRLYPEAKVSPVTIVVGRGRPVAIGGPGGEGVQIGLEALCAVSWLNPNVEDRFVHVIAHEYAHVQQSPALADDEHPTVLELALIEGGAEFVAELSSGSVGYSQFKVSTKGHETEIETAFVADEDKTDVSNWFNNSTVEKPGDLGYWVGYRIAKSYYQHAGDKRRALRDILQVTDPQAFLAKSGWRPGLRLDGASRQ
ncbi:MAG TPA: DUF2268 domain-containing putative Zn-dependent protease [Phenylobacterium sp.]|jgi:hypothetical protein|nr:DUF2268 domain-containing putative Zn-dependent protease [Phenylobacterium sp.]